MKCLHCHLVSGRRIHSIMLQNRIGKFVGSGSGGTVARLASGDGRIAFRFVFFCKTPRQAMGSTQLPIQCVPGNLYLGLKVARPWSWSITSIKCPIQEHVEPHHRSELTDYWLMTWTVFVQVQIIQKPKILRLTAVQANSSLWTNHK